MEAQIDPVGELVLPAGSDGAFWSVAEKDGYVYAITSFAPLASLA